MENLLKTLQELNISLKLRGDKVDIYDPQQNLSEKLLSSIKDNKLDIVSLLKDTYSDYKFSSIPKAEEKECYKLSSAQSRMYFLYALDENSLAYNMPQFFKFDEKLDLKRLNFAFNALIDRHEIFRTIFYEKNDQPVQEILETVNFEIETFQLDKGGSITELFEKFIRPFDLNKGPLIRVALVDCASTEQYLFIDMHHIVTDGVSYDIMYRDFMSLYQGVSLAPLVLQYKDYAEWQQSDEQQKEKEKQKVFWKDIFSETVPVLDLPYDFSRPPIKSYAGDTYSFALDQKTTAKLRTMAAKSGVTMYTLILGIYLILLNKISNQKEIVIGSPVSGRTHSELENIIGFFVNTLPLKVMVETNATFSSFLATLHKTVLACFENQSYQYEELVDEMQITRDPSRNPIFDILFTFENFSNADDSNEAQDIDIEGPKVSKFDCTLIASDSEKELNLSFEYSTELFKQETIEKFAKYFKNIVQAITESTTKEIGNISILDANEEKELLHDFNQTNKVYPSEKTLVDLFEDQVKRTPKNDAIFYDGNSITFESLNEQANQFAYFLIKEYGVNIEDFVGVKLERSSDLIIVLFAILKSGAVYIPINPDYPESRIVYIESDSKCKLIVDKTVLKKFRSIKANFDIANPKVPINTSNLAYVIYTSGSTGKPKGVMIEHKGIVNTAYSQIQSFNINSEDNCLQFSNQSFDASVWEIFITLLGGATLYIIQEALKSDVHAFVNYIKDNKISWATLPPAFFTLLNTEDIATIKTIVTAGEKAVLEKSIAYAKIGRFVNGYGPTETSICASVYEGEITNSIPIGKPIDNTKIFILNNEYQLVPKGTVGELCVSGIGVARGYLNKPALTKEKFRPNPCDNNEVMYCTGDLARWLPDGNIEFIGRKDEQVKIRGHRIELGEIEETLLKHNSVNEALVVALGEDANKYLVAYFTNDDKITTADLKQYLNVELPQYMVPAHFVGLDAFPLTLSGKIDKKLLPVPSIEQDENFTGPTNNGEQKLLKIWSEVLELDEQSISTNKSFFDLGGHSLKVIMLVNKIHRAFKVKLPVKEIFVNQDIKSLAAFIKTQKTVSFASIPKAKENAFYKQSSAQERMYFLNTLDKDSLAYNMPQVYRLQGNLDKKRLEKAINIFIERHEIFRTTFHTQDDQFVQKIAPEFDFKLDAYQIEQTLVHETIDNYVQTFDLEKLPLIRAAMLELPSEENYLLLDMHHIITDGVSNRILFNELIAIYEGKELPTPSLQYKDYAEWQKSEPQQKIVEKQKEFWLAEYDEVPTPINLPTDFARPVLKNYKGDTYSFKLKPAQAKQLRQLAEESDVTMYMLLLAIYNIFLFKLTGQKDLVIGSPVSGRQHDDLEMMMGLFVNVIPLRNQVDTSESFSDFIQSLKQKVLSCFENQDFEYEQLVNLLKITPDSGRNPLFDVLFSYDNNVLVTPNSNAEASPNPPVAKFDLALIVVDSGDDLICNFEYFTDLFERKTIERFRTYFENLIDSLTAFKTKQLATISFLPETEKRKLLVEFNDTKASYPDQKTLVDLFEDQAQNIPDNVAMVFDGHSITFKKLNEKANQFAHFLLQNHDIGVGDYVGLKINRTADLIVAILAILKSGGVYIPINPDYPEDRIQYIEKDSQCKLSIDDQLMNQFYAECAAYPITNPKIKITPKNLAYVLYTSGSTGQPKGVMVEHGGVVNLVHYQVRRFDIQQSDNCLQFASQSFDASIWEIFISFYGGATLVIINEELKSDIDAFTKFINANNITWATLTPSFFSMLDCEKLTTIKTMVTGGEKAVLEKSLAFSKIGRFVNVYGPTEASIVVTNFEGEFTTKIPIGKPVANIKMYILDEDDQLVPIGSTGKLYISGVGVARGYLNRAELTQEKFRVNPFDKNEIMYTTGDLAKWLPDGNIEFIGREDEQVKIRGHRIELGEIEKSLVNHKLVNDALVSVTGADANKFLVAHYTANEKISVDILKQFLLADLPHYMVPAHFVYLPVFPLTINGKIDRKALPEPSVEIDENFNEPIDQDERKLRDIWSEVLALNPETISTNKSFFDLGGHSLNVIMLVNKIHKVFQVKLPVKEIFVHQNIQSIVAFIRKQQKVSYESIPQAPEKPNYKQSSTQERMFFLNSLNENSLAYNMPQIYRFQASLDEKRLEKAINLFIERHEIFRTTFHTLDGEFVQKISPEYYFKLDTFSIEKSQIGETIDHYIRTFDLGKLPLVRAAIVKLPTEENYLLIDMHHIITDGVSNKILFDELIAIYEGKKLPTPQLQYKDYAEWQKSEKQQLVVQQQKEFWLEEFNEIPTPINLPTDFSRPAIKSHQGDTIVLNLNNAQTKQLRTIAEQSGATMYMLVLALYKIFLYKLTGQKDMVIGSPVSGRQHDDLENMIGLFVNVIPIRNQINPSENFMDFLQRTKSKILSCFENQSFEYEQLVDLLALTPDASRNPLFDVFFSYDNNMLTETASSTEDTSDSPNPPVAKFDLALSTIDTGRELIFNFEYSTDLFTRERMNTFARYFKQLIDLIESNPLDKIASINLLTKDEQLKIASDSNNTASKFPSNKTVIDLFEIQINETPDQTALIFGNTNFTYQEVDQKANQLANALRDQYQIEQGDIVTLYMNRSVDLVLSILATMKLGAAYVPIAQGTPKERIAFIVKETNAKVIITNDGLNATLDGLENKHVDFDIVDWSSYSTKRPNIVSKTSDLIYLIYTSGSTGKPKAVMVENRSVVNYLSWGKTYYLKENFDNHNFGLFTSFAFDLTVTSIFLPLISGNALKVYNADLDIVEILQSYLKDNLACIKMTPSHINLLQNLDLKSDALKVAIVGGEELQQSHIEILKKINPEIRIINEYGPTETTVGCTISEIASAQELITIGKPISNTTAYILDENLNIVPEGVVGELYIGGEGVTRGYLNRDELTASKFVKIPAISSGTIYQTGDRARWLLDGNIEYLGRIDNQIKIRGHRIELREINHHILQHADINEAVVLTFENQHKDGYLSAFYTSDKVVPEEELVEFLSTSLPDYMIPIHFIKMEKMPLTSNGKIDKNKLPHPNQELVNKFVKPETKDEKRIAQIWSQVLNIDAEKVGITTSFFKLGGNSLRTVQLQMLLKKSLNIEVPLVSLLKTTTIAGFIKKHKVTSQNNNSVTPNLILLNETKKAHNNLFLIHDGFGDIDGYNQLILSLPKYNCIGIRSALFDKIEPKNLTFKDLVADYIKDMKKIQPSGPYRILGWSLGGVLGFELTRQLEQMGDKVSFLMMLDSAFSSEIADPNDPHYEGFKAENEREMISNLLSVDPKTLFENNTGEKLWENTLSYLLDNNYTPQQILKSLPKELHDSIPNNHKYDLKNLLVCINNIRSINRARVYYKPSGKIQAPLVYVAASESNNNVDELLKHFQNEKINKELKGNHFTILNKSGANQLATIIESLEPQLQKTLKY